MKRILPCILLLVVVIAGWASYAQDQAAEEPDEKQPSVWMKRKLSFAQNILEGITSADFDEVEENARAMQGLGRFENFARGRVPGYRAQLNVFQEATDELIRQADKESVEGSALAFTQLTIACVNCHKQLREHEDAKETKETKGGAK